MATLPLSTCRLILRPLKEADAGTMFAYRSRPEVWRYQIWRPADISEIRKYIETQQGLSPGTSGTWFSLAIILRGSGEMIGDLGLHFPESGAGEAEIGITLSPDYQKRGYAAEALDAAVRFLFFTLGKTRICASVDPRNTASIHLLEKLGMRRQAFLPGSMIIREETVDDMLYALRREDYQNKSSGS